MPELPDVAGVEVAVGDGLRRRRFVFVVAQHYVAALHADFALAVFVGVVNADFRLGQRQPDRLVVVEAGTVDGNERPALGDAVAVDERDADAVEKVGQEGLERRAAADDAQQLAAERRRDRLEQLLAHIDAHLEHRVGYLDQLAQHAGLARLLRLVPDAAVNLFHKQRHELHLGRLVDLEVGQNAAQALVDADRHPVMEHRQQPAGRFVGMVIGQHRKADVGDFHQLLRLHNVEQQRVRRQHHALAFARRAGGEQQLLEDIIVDGRFGEPLVAAREQLAALFGQRVGRVPAFPLRRRAETDDRFQLRQRRQQPVELGF